MRALGHPIPSKTPRRAPLVALAALLLSACSHMAPGSVTRPIPRDERLVALVPSETHASLDPEPIPAAPVPPHPFMAENGASCMHGDAYTSNTYPWAGPEGHHPEVLSRAMGFVGGECPTVNFDRQGRIVTVCMRGRKPSLLLLDPQSLAVLARTPLPTRNTARLRIRTATNDTSGGVYFYLDHRDRAVIGTSEGNLDTYALDETGTAPRFVREERTSLQEALRRRDGSLDKISAVMPDHDGNVWFVGRYGTVGFVTPDHIVHSTKLRGEEIENSLSIAEDGVYVVTDHALYRLDAAQGTAVHTAWREPYDRGTRRKLGQINQGSGTSPTLLGEDYVAIADNAEPRMNVLVYRRRGEEGNRLVCRVPVFEPGRSATENTMIGVGRSLVVENNYGYDIFMTMRHGRTTEPGIARIDVRADESGCDVVWVSHEISQTVVPKLSIASGLIYAYTKLEGAPHDGDAYYFTAIDFETGRTVYRVLTGTGLRYDNHWAEIAIAPDGTAYVGVLNGVLRIRDRTEAELRPAMAVAPPGRRRARTR
ncbi:MAG: hypothetical protein U0230_10875 [Polyangiales bacterium]